MCVLAGLLGGHLPHSLRRRLGAVGLPLHDQVKARVWWQCRRAQRFSPASYAPLVIWPGSACVFDKRSLRRMACNDMSSSTLLPEPMLISGFWSVQMERAGMYSY